MVDAVSPVIASISMTSILEDRPWCSLWFANFDDDVKTKLQERRGSTAAKQGSTGRAVLVILLDTKFLSAMMRAAIEPAVERWLDAQPAESVWITSITVFEIHFGLKPLRATLSGARPLA